MLAVPKRFHVGSLKDKKEDVHQFDFFPREHQEVVNFPMPVSTQLNDITPQIHIN